MRIIFMGTPAFSIPSLRVLHEDYSIVGVVTQPDRPAGRSRRLQASPVKVVSEELELLILQPDHITEIIDKIEHLAPDLIVVAAFGQILPAQVLDVPNHGSLNVHASLLPRWRGAAPIQASILSGDKETGITLMLMDEGLDTGPILAQESLLIDDRETAGELSQRLAQLGAEILHGSLPAYFAGELQPIAQDGTAATYAPQLRKADGHMDFNLSATDLERQLRAYSPWPGSFFYVGDTRINVVEVSMDSRTNGEPGEMVEINGTLAVRTKEGTLVLERIHPAGKKTMPGKAYLAGNRDILGQLAQKMEY